MAKFLDKMFYLIGFLGVLTCVVAGIARLSGSYYIIGFEAMTLLIAGIALMVLACLLKLESISGNIAAKQSREGAT